MAVLSNKPLESQEIMPGVYSINNSFVNLYLVKSGDKYIAFDAGADINTIKNALKKLSINENDVSAVFLTHTDGDHVAGVSLFMHAKIYMSLSNSVFINNEDGAKRSKSFIDMKREYKTLNDGETVIEENISVQCIFTPGHTPGSACFLVDGKYLFAGDNLNLKDGKAVLFHDVYNMNNNIQEESLRMLSKLDGIEAVFSMHTGYTVDFKSAFTHWAD